MAAFSNLFDSNDMQYRELGRTGWKVSTVSFGAWAIGGTWGPTDDAASMAALHKPLDLGVNFFDTADVYGDGHGERLLARLRRSGATTYIATKAGRRLNRTPPRATSTCAALSNAALQNLQQTDTIDLLQPHRPPTTAFYTPEVFDGLDRLVKEGSAASTASASRRSKKPSALDFPGVQSVQIIFNLFRQRGRGLCRFAAQRKVGILARLPLSSGMLGGKLTPTSTFAEDDHRHFNRDGAGFDKGETFSARYDAGLAAVERIRPLVPAGMSMASWRCAGS